jgi:thioredoxin reductase
LIPRNPDKEIIIVGAGSTGLSAAFFLAQKGLHPVIFEKRPERKKISKASASIPIHLVFLKVRV